MAKKIMNLPSVEDLTKNTIPEPVVKHEEQEDIIEPVDVEDITDEFQDVEDGYNTDEDTDYEEAYQEPQVVVPVQPKVEYSEEEEAEALEEIVKERESKKAKTPKKLKKGVVIGVIALISIVVLAGIGYFVVSHFTSVAKTPTVTQPTEGPKKQDFENFERLILKSPTVADDEQPAEDKPTKSGQEIVQSYSLEYPYVDLTLKEDADGQFVLIYNKNDKQVLCYSQENQFVAGEQKRVALSCEIDDDMSNEKPVSYMFRESD